VSFTKRRCGNPFTSPCLRLGLLQPYSKGTAYGKKAWRRAHPIEEDEDYWDDIGEAPPVDVAAEVAAAQALLAGKGGGAKVGGDVGGAKVRRCRLTISRVESAYGFSA